MLDAAGTKSACRAAVDIQGPRGLEAAASVRPDGRDFARGGESPALVWRGRRRPREERPGTVAGQGRAPEGGRITGPASGRRACGVGGWRVVAAWWSCSAEPAGGPCIPSFYLLFAGIELSSEASLEREPFCA